MCCVLKIPPPQHWCTEARCRWCCAAVAQVWVVRCRCIFIKPCDLYQATEWSAKNRIILDWASVEDSHLSPEQNTKCETEQPSKVKQLFRVNTKQQRWPKQQKAMFCPNFGPSTKLMSTKSWSSWNWSRHRSKTPNWLAKNWDWNPQPRSNIKCCLANFWLPPEWMKNKTVSSLFDLIVDCISEFDFSRTKMSRSIDFLCSFTQSLSPFFAGCVKFSRIWCEI